MPTEIRIALPAWIDEEIDRARAYTDDHARVGLAIRLAFLAEVSPADARHVLEAGIPWGWETFGEYLDHLRGLGTSVNVEMNIPIAQTPASISRASTVRSCGSGCG